MRKIYLWAVGLMLGLMAACQSSTPQVPTQYEGTNQQANIFPDYTNVVIPSNIAPLNYMVKDSLVNACVAVFQGKGEAVTAGSNSDKVIIDSLQWRKMLQENVGGDIRVTLYVQQGERWYKHPEYTLTVAKEEIDPYLSYRLIEPGYELYRQLGLYQRNLTNFEQKSIYENNRSYNEKENHCVNCHNYQNYSTRNFLFHVRANHGGTMIVEDNKVQKVQIKDSTILTAGVYPSWHPTKNLIVFSTNKTGQTFHIYHQEKIEVMDEQSDLLLYDAGKNEVRHILRSHGQLETFPCWTPDGKQLYYCCADLTPMHPDVPTMSDSILTRFIVTHYDSIHYDLMRMDFDEKNMSFSEPEKIIDCAAMRKSITLPRVSPDGQFVLYTLADYGQFHIWHKSSDLWVKNLTSGEEYPLKEANSPDVDSYHSWSSNGRWIVFSSRRDDGNYTRPYIAYFDAQGRSRKAFMLPQEDPEQNILLLKSYNVPELTRDAVTIPESELRQCIYNSDGENSKYITTAATEKI